jgi:hypothetical protein
MKDNILFDEINDMDESTVALKVLKTIEQKFSRETDTKRDIIEWQLVELKRLQSEVFEKSNAIVELNTKLMECRSQSEGNRQLINKLITDIDKLQQNIDWYKRTYETRSLFGVIKDKLKYFFK